MSEINSGISLTKKKKKSIISNNFPKIVKIKKIMQNQINTGINTCRENRRKNANSSLGKKINRSKTSLS